MAQITMDSSEWEAMKKVEKLLQESLDKERSLQEQIKKLSEEKLKALEDAKMKVVKTHKTEVTSHLLRKRPLVNLRELIYILGLNPQHTTQIRHPEDIDIDSLIKVFFEKVETITTSVDSVEMFGLDEMKAEITKTVTDSIDEATKNKLLSAEKAISAHAEIYKVNVALERTNANLVKDKTILVESLEQLGKKHDVMVDNTKLIKDLREVIPTIVPTWGKADILTKVIRLLSK